MTTVTLIPGDGIGPEISEAMKLVLDAAGAGITWETVELVNEGVGSGPAGLPDNLIKSVRKNKLAIKGPTTTPIGTGHRSLNVRVRQAFDLYANVRPVCSLPGLQCQHKDVDMIIVRENTEDLYAGLEYKVDNDTVHGIKLITRKASTRIARYAFELARKLGRRKVTAVHKANIMKLSDGLFLECVREVAGEFGDIQFSDIIIDNCCMQMVTKPSQFDVLVTENLYGDIISDLGAGLIGGLGVAAGGNIGKDCAIFEAVHGSAPDIAGKGLANPTALIASAVMMLEHMGKIETARKICQALHNTLATTETRTKDLGGKLSTQDFAAAIVQKLRKG